MGGVRRIRLRSKEEGGGGRKRGREKGTEGTREGGRGETQTEPCPLFHDMHN